MWKAALSGVQKERVITYFHAGCWSADFPWELCIPATFVLMWLSQWSSFSHPHKFWGKAPRKGCRTCCEERGGYWKLTVMWDSESTDCFESNFGRYFPLKLRQILQARMKAAMLVHDTLACCTPEQLEHCTSYSDWMDPYPRLPASGRFCGPSKGKGTWGKTQCPATVHLLWVNCSQEPLPFTEAVSECRDVLC